jgi:GTP-binding protein HflX
MTETSPYKTGHHTERVLVCGVLFDDQTIEHEGPLTEVRGLCVAAGVEVIGEGITQNRSKASPATLMGRGKAEEIAVQVELYEPDAVVVDNDLSPAQVRNLEQIFCVRVVDRSELILDIFSRRVSTRQSRLQVELAQVEYLIPRLRRMWTHLERQQGGIGMRGPGETQLETDQRLLMKRVTDLKRELKNIEARKRRQVQSRSEVYTLGLIGYTNAGKSTLLNVLTGADELAADMLFATLDTRTRKWKMEDGRTVLVSDTVGFLQRLPHHLVASFHATLEEALNVDLLVHVVDTAHPDVAEQMAAVDDVLGDLSAHRFADMLVYNKVDLFEGGKPLFVNNRKEEAVFVSAKSGTGLDKFEAMVAEHLDRRSNLVRATVPAAAGALQASLRRFGSILEEEYLEDGTAVFLLRISEAVYGRLQREMGCDVLFEMIEPATEHVLVERESESPEWME